MTDLWERAETTPTPSFVTAAVRSPGKPLDEPERTLMEGRFGYDFGNIRIHTDAEAASSAERLGAAAYAAGQHIVFAPGQYGPGVESGRRLLAHELGPRCR